MLLSSNNRDSAMCKCTWNSKHTINNPCNFPTDTLPLIYMFSMDIYGKLSNWLNLCELLANHLFHIYECLMSSFICQLSGLYLYFKF